MFHLVHKVFSRSLTPWLTSLVLAVWVVGCGGGGTDTAGNGVGVGGTGAAATGPVTGYGSLIVNNIHFGFANARFTTEDADDADGNDRFDETPPDNLSEKPVGFGTVVSISSDSVVNQSNGDQAAEASLITLVSAIKGPIANIAVSQTDPKAGTLTVLGQTVQVDASTQYGRSASVQWYDLSRLRRGDNIVVYGSFDRSTGTYMASRVEYRPNMVTYKVRGYITALPGNNSVTVGGLTVALPARLSASSFKLGQLVRVRMLATNDKSTPVQALVVKAVGSALTNGVQTHQDGVAGNVSPGEKTFQLDGVTVDFSQLGTLPAQFGDGKRVTVVGAMKDGVLVATRIDPEYNAEDGQPNFTSRIKLTGPISNISNSGSNGQFTLRGLTVQYTSPVVGNGVALVNGQWVEVEGTSSTTQAETVVATKISPKQPPH